MATSPTGLRRICYENTGNPLFVLGSVCCTQLYPKEAFRSSKIIYEDVVIIFPAFTVFAVSELGQFSWSVCLLLISQIVNVSRIKLNGYPNKQGACAYRLHLSNVTVMQMAAMEVNYNQWSNNLGLTHCLKLNIKQYKLQIYRSN